MKSHARAHTTKMFYIYTFNEVVNDHKEEDILLVLQALTMQSPFAPRKQITRT